MCQTSGSRYEKKQCSDLSFDLGEVQTPRQTAMCQGACCNAFASNLEMQLVYIAAAVVQSLAMLGYFIVSEMEGHELIAEWTYGIIGLGSFALWIMMIASRLIAPCCCKELMPDVPNPCPPCESCMVLMDYPFMIGAGGDLLTTLVIIFIGYGDEDSRGILRTQRLFTWGWCVAAGACTGCVKYQLLWDQQWKKEMEKEREVENATVVGAPVEVVSQVVG